MIVVFLLFFFSGCAALIYELLWFRQLGFTFGNTVHAATAVVTAYMAGLALGAMWIARNADRARRPVRWFATFESMIGLYALAVPFLFQAVRLAYRFVYQHISTSTTMLTPFRFFLAMIVMLLPTFLMGATLPLLSRGLASREEGFGRRLGLLYGFNTLGAVTGLVAAGFFLIPALGLRGTNWVAVSCNLGVALFALIVDARSRAVSYTAIQEVPESDPDALARRALWSTALCGFVALGFEVVWFRALVLVFGSTTYSFSAMLATFLAGIGLGAAVFGGLADRARKPLLLLAASQIITGVYSLAILHRFDHQPELLVNFLIKHGFAWRNLLTSQFLITAEFLLVPTLMMGLAFTAAGKALRHSLGDSARAVASGYIWNTAGCVVGSLCAGFIFLPRFGLQNSLLVFAVLAIALAAWLVASESRRIPVYAASVAAVVLAVGIAWSSPRWCKPVLAAGAYFSPWNFERNGKSNLFDQLDAQELLFYREGVTATASVSRGDNMTLTFSMDGKVEADSSPQDMALQRMLGHLPMLFHPNPKSVMNLGLGAGVTFGSLSCYPLDHLEVVEIEPTVTNVARILNAFNHAVIEQTNAIVTINDGRNHLFCTMQKYDVIASDPYEPVVGGAAHLFTVEHFRQARERLNSGGIMCQWVPMYEMSRRDFLTIIRSFVNVFPQSCLFFTGVDVVLLGFKDQVHLSLEDVRRKFEIPKVRASLAELGFTKPETIVGMFVADMSAAKQFTGDGPLNTDNDPVIEYSTPKSAVHFTTDQNQQVLLDNFTPLPAALLAGCEDTSISAMQRSHASLQKTIEASVHRDRGDVQSFFNLLRTAHEEAPDNPVIANELGLSLVAAAKNSIAQNDRDTAAAMLQYALGMNPRDFWTLFHLSGLAIGSRNFEFARDGVSRLIAAHPEAPLAWIQKARIEITYGCHDDAATSIARALELGGDKPNICTEVAKLYTAINRPTDARIASDKADKARAARRPK